MLSMEVRRKDVFIKSGYEMLGDISGIIGLSGVTTGTCALSISRELATCALRRMLMLPDSEPVPDSDINDGVGELINMIAGGAKTRLAPSCYKFNITLPTIISGGNHEVFHRTGAYCVVVRFETQERDLFALELCVSAN